MSDPAPDQDRHEPFVLTDDELEAMALAGPDDASPSLLPEWYMPRPMTRTRASWPVVIAALVIVGFLVIDAFGLCITSGFLSWA